MPELGQGTVMQTTLSGVTTGPGPLLRMGTRVISEIGMIFNLCDRNLMEQLFFAVTIRPGDKFNSCLAMAINHVADITVGPFNSHDTRSRDQPQFCSNGYRISRNPELLNRIRPCPSPWTPEKRPCQLTPSAVDPLE